MPPNSNSNSNYLSDTVPVPITSDSPQINSNGNGNGNGNGKQFLSSAADLEYSILGSIIQQDFLSPDNSNGINLNHMNTQQQQQFLSPAVSNSNSEDTIEYLNYQPLMYQNQQQLYTPNNNNVNQFVSPSPQESRNNNNINLNFDDLYSMAPKCDSSTNQYFIGSMKTPDLLSIKTFTFPEVVKLISLFRNQNPLQFHERNKKSAISFSIGIINDENGNDTNYLDHNNDTLSSVPTIKTNTTTTNNNKLTPTSTPTPCGLHFQIPSEIYSKIKKPFSYVKPYHDLNLYLRSRFNKSYLVSMSKSMSEYRPSFIAGMIHLTSDDMIFAEQCFQRTLLEYDNYIKISGTPTLVWRRTSQIAYVGDEFCILTGWCKKQLLEKSTFAVEIMDDKSCVEYFKLFSKIAFGDFRGATMTECTLLTPNGESIRTSCIWTLKRDVFGIPMMIIANFLPILT
ncbi:hypothetical protein CANARDRAFT_200640 [[Candida] arabinofermentans NRRL YB-2248]|uniref:ERT1/acuK family PAS domain-containing protein n=1 Tax=[Candida] arabinofermentans NRRL YB-2248 TaxID=983967 RepID=A0A1E4SYC0_9ASCO|nr:hypothetical protein CANARDRAFT_200640 [[Candida] arabinofermentans NRRL YB-2248]